MRRVWACLAGRFAPQASPAATLAASGLFDAGHYAAAAGLAPDAASCIAHYLRQGWRQSPSPSRLFDPAGYLALNPDVARAGGDPFLHLLRHGLREGRRLPPLPPALLEGFSGRHAALRALTLDGRALRAGATAPPRLHYPEGDGEASLLARHLAKGWPGARDLVIAPHALPALAAWPARRLSRALLVNTARPGSLDFLRSLPWLKRAALVLEPEPETALLLHDLGVAQVAWLPYGWQAGADDWQARPLDVLVSACLTPARSHLLARLAPALARWRCHLTLPTPLHLGERPPPELFSLPEERERLRRSRVLLLLPGPGEPLSPAVHLALRHGARPLVVTDAPVPAVLGAGRIAGAPCEAVPALLDEVLARGIGP